MLMSPMRDGRTTSEDSATQLLICEPLSFAIFHQLTYYEHDKKMTVMIWTIFFIIVITFIVTIKVTIAMKMNLTDSYNEHQQKVSQRPEVQSRQVRFNLDCRNHFETKEWFDDNDDKLHSMMMMMIMQMMKMMILTWWVSLLIEPPLMNWKWRIFPTCHHHHYANMSHMYMSHDEL